LTLCASGFGLVAQTGPAILDQSDIDLARLQLGAVDKVIGTASIVYDEAEGPFVVEKFQCTVIQGNALSDIDD
jgi:hypothetical protein